MSKVVVQEKFGGPEVLEIREIEEPHAGPGQVRVRAAAAGLNPIDWILGSSAERAAAFGVALPSGFGNDFAGTVDEVGAGVTDFAVGDRVYGGARGHAVAEYIIHDPSKEELRHTPDGVDDLTAATLHIAGRTAAAAQAAVGLTAGDTVLIGGAAGGVGVFSVQLAVIAGARVIATGSEGSFDFLRGLGAEPVAYGDGIVDRVRALAPDGITAAIDLHGSDVALAALELGAMSDRIATIASHDPEVKAKAVGGRDAVPNALEPIAALIAEGRITIPIAGSYPMDRIREAVTFQSGRHAHGKVVVTL